jgi:hypothetical protein
MRFILCDVMVSYIALYNIAHSVLPLAIVWLAEDSGMSKRFSSSLHHPDWFCGPPSLLFCEYWEQFPCV